MAEVLIALGSNLGDRIGYLRNAVECLAEFIETDAVGRVYETAPMYVIDQPGFLNTAVRGRTSLGPWPLLKAMKGVERSLGRRERERSGPREIDLDLIAYGSARVVFSPAGERLEVPHPRTWERRFVLQPLADVAPETVLIGQGRILDLLRATEDQSDSVLLTGHAVFPL